jgi:arylsulfatase A-like enzyme
MKFKNKSILLLCVSLFPLGFHRGVAAETSQPNIVLIVVDDLGWRDLGCYGSTFYETPNIDSLARKGMRFTDSYSTNPLCSPTRASIMTGIDSARMRFTSPGGHDVKEILEGSFATKSENWSPAKPQVSINRLKTSYTTLPTVLANAGYRTGHFGKWHLGQKPYSPLEHGFSVDIPATALGWPMKYWGPCKYPNLNLEAGEHIDQRLAKEALKFIDASPDKPFFVNYWTFSVHSPYTPDPSLIDKYQKKIDPKNAQKSPVMGAMIQSLDEAVGILIEGLKERKLFENTIILLTSDNGGTTFELANGVPVTSNEPLRLGKASIREGGVRVPLIVSWPQKISPATVSAQLVSSVDFFPTFLDLAGISPKEELPIDGYSFAPALKGKTGGKREDIFIHFPHNVAITEQRVSTIYRQDQWKLYCTHHAGENGTDLIELYNLSEDISEKNDLAPSERNRSQKMEQAMNAYFLKYKISRPPLNETYDKTQFPPKEWGKKVEIK